MHLIVGLGNPGERYSLTRHNLGFRVVEKTAREKEIGPAKGWRKAVIARSRLHGYELMLAQPLTYMNRSGIAVAEISRYFKISPAEILVIYDDLDLSPGSIRLRPQGGNGGHKGVASVIRELGTEGFPRLRMGIGHPPPGEDPARYVLKPFLPPEEELIEEAVSIAVEAIVVFVKEGIEAAMNKFN